MNIRNLGRKKTRALAIAVSGVGVAATVLFGSGTAQALTPTQQVWTGPSLCLANLYIQPGTSVGQTNSHDYAQAGVYQSSQDSSVGCSGWLERSTDGGADWTPITDYHNTFAAGATGYTDWYYDGPGYMARACALDANGGKQCTQGY